MRLLTHNYLQSNVKGTEQGYPLLIEPETIEIESSPVDRELLLNLVPKLNYHAIVQALQDIRPYCHQEGIALPDLSTTTDTTTTTTTSTLILSEKDETMIKDLHYVLFDIHIQNGYLICPATKRRFPIKDGIPNMILHEDEV